MKICKSTLTWDNAPDTITPYDLAKILGCGENTARNIFNQKNFPRIPCTGVKQIADKQMAHLWIRGFNNYNPTSVTLLNILEVLERIEKQIGGIYGEEN